ncbi:MAG: MmcQ/YjbR family DNA-binding protein [Hellea sp.]|nr:MmcQ/YjbR family DNA-binding protein [Hellea sp.]
MTTRDLTNKICASLPGSENSDPWKDVGKSADHDGPRHDVWKIGGKMYACVGSKTPGVSVKTDSIETAQMLIDVGLGTKAPYFHRSWVLLNEDVDEDELRHRLIGAYKIIRGKLTKKAQAALPPFEG